MGSPITPQLEANSDVRSPARTTRILIADDNPIVRTVMHSLIEVNAALEVCGEAVTGPDAIQQAQELRPDMVLLDLRMPGMNGLQVAPLIKQALPGVFIVLFTMLEKEISETLRTAANIDLVLRKPQGLDTLLKSIQDFVPTN
jgi:CheY-like chemotaxis protein